MDFEENIFKKNEKQKIHILAHLSAILNLCVFHDGTPSNIN